MVMGLKNIFYYIYNFLYSNLSKINNYIVNQSEKLKCQNTVSKT